MATNELRVELPCSCGGSVTARIKDAGGTILCSCGKPVAVPKLSELRTQAGADAFITNPVEAIRKLQRQGIDPTGGKCVACGSATAVTYQCHASCEASHLNKASGDGSPTIARMVTFLFLPHFITWLAYCFRSPQSSETERRGHDVSISFNLPVCDPCTLTTGKVTRPAVAKTLMRKVPLFDELLKYYPTLQLKVARANR